MNFTELVLHDDCEQLRKEVLERRGHELTTFHVVSDGSTRMGTAIAWCFHCEAFVLITEKNPYKNDGFLSEFDDAAHYIGTAIDDDCQVTWKLEDFPYAEDDFPGITEVAATWPRDLALAAE